MPSGPAQGAPVAPGRRVSRDPSPGGGSLDLKTNNSGLLAVSNARVPFMRSNLELGHHCN